jgi:phage tail sheath protein FI
MPFQVSPGVNVSEVDLSTVVPAVSTTEGAIAGVFKWGPAKTRVLVDSEETLVARFGKPKGDLNPETFFTAANFLAYGNKLYVSRVIDSSSLNAGSNSGVLIENEDKIADVTISDAGNHFVAKYPGSLGDSLKVSVCKTADEYEKDLGADISIASGANSGTASADLIALGLGVGDILKVGNSTTGVQYLTVSTITVTEDTNTTGRTFTTEQKYTGVRDITSLNGVKLWNYHSLVNGAPGTSSYVESKGGVGDEIHVVVIDEDGDISGTKGTVIEVFEGVSRATDAKTESGESNYWIDVIEKQSQWIYAKAATGLAANVLAASSTALSGSAATYDSLTGGVDSAAEGSISLADIADGYDLFKEPADIDISLILQGKAIGGTNKNGLANHIIDNICESRKDCILFASPDKADVVNNIGSEIDDIITFRNGLTNTSYALLDSGYKYQYDKYDDVYRYLPLNGDIAGLAVRSDTLRDAWFSPAGYNRGAIKNLVKLAFNPKKGERDSLYQKDINPVVTFPGQGTILFGDKTLLGKPSAFDRINVRRLFIVLEKAISTASKFSLFEFNDSFTQSQFKNLVEPFLRDIQGRRGIVDFRVVCDDTNNTGEVIDRNEFVGDIYVKPSRSINFIQLNFVAVRSGVEFSEVVGQF